MPTDDLSSIPGLEDKHLRALARQQVTDLRSFADADRRDIHRAMGNSGRGLPSSRSRDGRTTPGAG